MTWWRSSRDFVSCAPNTDEPFEIQTVCIDRFGRDGYAELEDAGVTDIITVPWIFDGIGFDGPLADKQDSLRKFADKYL